MERGESFDEGHVEEKGFVEKPHGTRMEERDILQKVAGRGGI